MTLAAVMNSQPKRLHRVMGCCGKLVNYPTLSGVPLQCGLVSELHRNSENLKRISALVSPLDT
jgi:hypothetical protein